MERDAALAELYEWMVEFKTVAKTALAHNPQLLETAAVKLGPACTIHASST